LSDCSPLSHRILVLTLKHYASSLIFASCAPVFPGLLSRLTDRSPITDDSMFQRPRHDDRPTVRSARVTRVPEARSSVGPALGFALVIDQGPQARLLECDPRRCLIPTRGSVGARDPLCWRASSSSRAGRPRS